MTIEDVIAVVEEETGHKVTPETELKELGMDSLDFLDLLIRVGDIPDAVVPRINKVSDLYLAAMGTL
jgi:acyl carrier protein